MLPLAELLLEIAFHKTQPVAIDHGFVFRVHGGDGVFAILNGADGRFQKQIFHTGAILGSDGATVIDLYLHMEAVMTEEDRRWLIRSALVTAELIRYGEGAGAALRGNQEFTVFHPVSAGIVMATLYEGKMAIEEVSRPGDHFCTAYGIVPTGALGTVRFRDRVGAIERIVEATPASVCRIESVTSIHHRHHQLGAGQHSNLRVHVGGADGEGLGFGK